MTVMLDCIALPDRFSGAAFYILHLTRSLLQQERGFNILVLCRAKHAHYFENYARPGDAIITTELHNRAHKLYFYEKQLPKLLLKNQVDLFLATHYITPPPHPAYSIISVFHDMGFMLHPGWYSIVKRFYFRKRMPVFVKRSDAIVTVSHNTRNELMRFFPQVEQKSLCIYPGTDHLSGGAEQPEEIRQTDRPYLLAVNSFEKRKNIPLIIDIFEELKNRYDIRLDLIIAGKNNNHSDGIQRRRNHTPFKDSITVFTDVSTGQLKYLYQKAALFVNTSLYEGFGFTPAEAISMGCPVFLYPNGAVRELFGEHAALVDSTKPAVWAERIFSAMQDDFAGSITPHALKDLTWANCAYNFTNLIETIKEKQCKRIPSFQ